MDEHNIIPLDLTDKEVQVLIDALRGVEFASYDEDQAKVAHFIRAQISYHMHHAHRGPFSPEVMEYVDRDL